MRMLRRRKSRKGASSYAGLALAKGPTRRERKTVADAVLAAVIREVRAQLFALTRVCACCGETEQQTSRRSLKWTHEMNEDPARSMTSGRPPEERFNLLICMRICPPCHHDYTANNLRCVPHTEAGFLGSYDVQRKNEAREWYTVRTVVQ